MSTHHVNTNDAREQFADLLTRVTHDKERIILTRRGREIAAIVPLDDFRRLLALQDEHDLADAIDALREARTIGTVSLEHMREEA